jgi:hypothetical protein
MPTNRRCSNTARCSINDVKAFGLSAYLHTSPSNLLQPAASNAFFINVLENPGKLFEKLAVQNKTDVTMLCQ